MRQILVAVLAALCLWASAGAQTKVDLANQGANVDFSNALSTKPARTGTALPPACSTGETFFKTDAPAGQNWHGCTSVNTWTVLGPAPELPAVQGNDNRVLSNDGSRPGWKALSGDVSGRPESLTVTGLQGRAVGNVSPIEGQVLKWSGARARWEPGDGSTTATASGGPNYSAAFTVQTTVSIPGSAHRLGTANVIVACYDAATPATRIEADSVSVDPVSFDITVKFTEPQTGRCVVNGSGGGGLITSLFGRTGAVLAEAGDYSFSQIAGSVQDSQIAQGVAASKISSGMVTNRAFDALASVRGDIQAQLDGKADRGHSHASGGDLVGDIEAARVSAIQGRRVLPNAPADGQALVWSDVSAAWLPGNVAGTSGAPKLQDFNVTRPDATTLVIGANCSDATPCNLRFGTRVFSITQACTATLVSGSGTALVYGTNTGTVAIGHNLSVSTSGGCATEAGVNSFPPDAIPLFTWTATNGNWDEAGGRDQRAWLSLEKVMAGTGVMVADSGGVTTVGVDPATVATYITAVAVLNFPPIADRSCTGDQSFAVPGAGVNDAVAPGWPAGLEPGLTGVMRVSASNTVSVRLCNFSGNTVDPASASFRATIVRSF